MINSKIHVVELFAGVGGFRLGLENYSKEIFDTIWANQWEPNKKAQHAFDCYVKHFGASENHLNEDIGLVKDLIPKHDLLVGGFPCQDYSVARTQAKGIEGRKGVLWWEINSIISKIKPNFVLLENVDRLIKSPASQRGRDFAVILRCFHDNGYSVEWRVINAADYGNVQRRSRVFIFAYRTNTRFYNKCSESTNFELIMSNGFFAKTFPVERGNELPKIHTDRNISKDEYEDLADLSNRFHYTFHNSGIMRNGEIYSHPTVPIYETSKTIRSIRLTNVDKKYFLGEDTSKWTYLKGPKKIERIRPNGEPYFYAEGGMSFPDSLDLPARTMLTSESSINRSTHVIEDADAPNKLRLLTPEECELINGFPAGWTDTGMPHKFRYFTMGNALVVPLITRMARTINEINKAE